MTDLEMQIAQSALKEYAGISEVEISKLVAEDVKKNSALSVTQVQVFEILRHLQECKILALTTQPATNPDYGEVEPKPRTAWFKKGMDWPSDYGK